MLLFLSDVNTLFLSPFPRKLSSHDEIEECSSVQSTPSNGSHNSALTGGGMFHGPDALSPTSHNAAPEMTRVLSGVTSGMHR